jgi:hypothetical protein
MLDIPDLDPELNSLPDHHQLFGITDPRIRIRKKKYLGIWNTDLNYADSAHNREGTSTVRLLITRGKYGKVNIFSRKKAYIKVP